MASEYAGADAMAKDPENRLLWRYRARRLDAEIIRDSILAVSGALNSEVGGLLVFPKIQAEVLASMQYGIWKQQKEDGPEAWRRSVYKRGLPMPMLEIFDLPNQNISCGARNVSTVPTQALALMNDDFVLRQAQLFANRLQEAAPDNPAKQVDLAYQLALNRPPDALERKLALDFELPRREPEAMLLSHATSDWRRSARSLNTSASDFRRDLGKHRRWPLFPENALNLRKPSSLRAMRSKARWPRCLSVSAVQVAEPPARADQEKPNVSVGLV